MIGVVNLDEAGLIEIIGIHDGTVILVVFAVQQHVDLAQELPDLLGG